MLSEEEKKAIKYLKILKKHLGKDKQEMIDTGTYKFYEAFEINLDIVLNLITKLEKENEQKNKEIDMLSKIISLMLDDLDTKGFGKENIYNSYKHRVEHNEQYFQ